MLSLIGLGAGSTNFGIGIGIGIGIEISIEIGIGIAFDEAAPRAQSDKKRKTLSHKQKTFDFDSGK